MQGKNQERRPITVSGAFQSFMVLMLTGIHWRAAVRTRVMPFLRHCVILSKLTIYDSVETVKENWIKN
jgi:hypothetical protein